jgi:uncharacterized protein (TIGR00369 family)
MSEAPRYEAPNPDFERTVRDRILGMPVAGFFGFRFGALEPGLAELVQPYREELSHQQGFFQGGVIGALADFAAGAAAGSLLPAGWQNATADYTVKIVAPGAGEELVARGRVIKAGRTLTVAGTDVYASKDGQETLCATALVTFRNLPTGRA